MPDLISFLTFLAAATVIAVTPGPGIFYVAARTLAGGRAEGMASSFGTGLGGLVHVVAGALGVSAIVMASAQAFTVMKIAGALYLLWLGYRTIRDARVEMPQAQASGTAAAFRQGILVEMFNPKTAAFFLAFIPQFIDPAGAVALQFIVLGLIAVVLNTLADVIVTILAAQARDGLSRRQNLMRRLREASGVVIGGLGLTLLFARRT